MLEYDDHQQRADRPVSSHRSRRKLAVVYTILLLMIVGALVYAVLFVSRDSKRTLRVGNPAGMVDHLDFFDTSEAFARGTSERVVLLNNSPAQLKLHDTRGRFPRAGSWTSPQVQTAFAFTELIPSYNPHCPPDTGVRYDVRARDARSANWSPWFYLGSWGRTFGKEKRLARDDAFGNVDVDTLLLRRPADAYQVRLSFYAFGLDDQINPQVRRLAVSYSGVVDDPDRREQLMAQANPPADFARDLPVPFRAQGNAAKPLRPEICSPTSVSMVMQYLGRDLPTEDNALGIYDSENDMFGNWGRAVAWAGENGFDAWLTRFRNWDQVKQTIDQGQPIIASIRFKKGECPSFVFPQTAGHLIVIRGVTKDGDLIVNDPASKARGNGAIYKADDLAKAWIAHGGVGYIIRSPRSTGF
jgi:hypothetical protein